MSTLMTFMLPALDKLFLLYALIFLSILLPLQCHAIHRTIADTFKYALVWVRIACTFQYGLAFILFLRYRRLFSWLTDNLCHNYAFV